MMAMDRRAFLRRAGAGALGIAAWRPLAALAEDAPVVTREMPSNWAWGRIPADWDEARRIYDETTEVAAVAVLDGIDSALVHQDDEVMGLQEAAQQLFLEPMELHW